MNASNNLRLSQSSRKFRERFGRGGGELRTSITTLRSCLSEFYFVSRIELDESYPGKKTTAPRDACIGGSYEGSKFPR